MTAPGHRAGHAVFSEVAKQQGLIRGVLLSCGAPVERIDDLVQDCMLVAWRAIQEGRFNPPDPTKPLPDAVSMWLSGIASRVAIEARRSLGRYLRTFQPTETQEHPTDLDAIAAPSAERVMMARDELALIARLKMIPKQREAVALAALGYTAPEIAERLGVPVDTVGSYLKRARTAYAKAKARQRHR